MSGDEEEASARQGAPLVPNGTDEEHTAWSGASAADVLKTLRGVAMKRSPDFEDHLEMPPKRRRERLYGAVKSPYTVA